MTLDETIIHEEKLMMKNLEKTKDRNASDPIAINCFKCADKHRQLAEWLKEYKRLMIAIDAIKAELESAKYLNYGQLYYLASGLNKALEIIEKHTSGGDENADSD